MNMETPAAAEHDNSTSTAADPACHANAVMAAAEPAPPRSMPPMHATRETSQRAERCPMCGCTANAILFAESRSKAFHCLFASFSLSRPKPKR
jgi:hypothetical protein